MPKWSAFRKISLPHLHGKNVNPHCPLEEKRLSERKKDAVIQIFFSLIYLDRKRLVGRKNLKIEKKQPYHRKGSVIGLLSIEKFTIV